MCAKRNVKRKSLARLRSDLWNRLRPEVAVPALAKEITKLLDTHVGKSTRNVTAAYNLAAYLTGKYSVSQRKKGELDQLIAFHADDLNEFLSRDLGEMA